MVEEDSSTRVESRAMADARDIIEDAYMVRHRIIRNTILSEQVVLLIHFDS